MEYAIKCSRILMKSCKFWACFDRYGNLCMRLAPSQSFTIEMSTPSTFLQKCPTSWHQHAAHLRHTPLLQHPLIGQDSIPSPPPLIPALWNMRELIFPTLVCPNTSPNPPGGSRHASCYSSFRCKKKGDMESQLEVGPSLRYPHLGRINKRGRRLERLDCSAFVCRTFLFELVVSLQRSLVYLFEARRRDV